jgi:hypothetical protein
MQCDKMSGSKLNSMLFGLVNIWKHCKDDKSKGLQWTHC